MNDSPAPPSSRRGFLKSAFLAVAASATGKVLFAADPPTAGAVGGAAEKLGADLVRPVSVQGIRPMEHVVGGIVVHGSDDDYLVFDAIQEDADGELYDSGTAAIRLENCLDWRIRNIGDLDLAPHPVDHADLDACATYEVVNSTWVTDLVLNHADPEAVLSGPKLAHLIFTFGEVSFECVVGSLNAVIVHGTFEDAYGLIP